MVNTIHKTTEGVICNDAKYMIHNMLLTIQIGQQAIIFLAFKTIPIIEMTVAIHANTSMSLCFDYYTRIKPKSFVKNKSRFWGDFVTPLTRGHRVIVKVLIYA